MHGRFGYPEAGGPFGAYHSSLDIYDRHTGRKLVEKVPLPEDSRVLGGGRLSLSSPEQQFPAVAHRKASPARGEARLTRSTSLTSCAREAASVAVTRDRISG